MIARSGRLFLSLHACLFLAVGTTGGPHGVLLQSKPPDARGLEAATQTQKTKLRIAGSSTVFRVVEAWAASPAMSSIYDAVLDRNGSSVGAKRVCLPYNDPHHVDIGDMSREWKSDEAEMMDDFYTYECKETKHRVTQIAVGMDGLAVVIANKGAAYQCLTNPRLSGLSLAQLRWIFSDWNDEQLAADGVDLASVMKNDDNDTIKEWSDLDKDCPEIPINPYGPDANSGTSDFFGEVVFCKTCFNKKANYVPESFRRCNQLQFAVDNHGKLVHELHLANLSATAAYLASSRSPNCYIPTELDEKILEWVLGDTGGIGYFGYSYYRQNAAILTAVRIASDPTNGIQDTKDAKIQPTSFTIIDGSYSVFRRRLYMNVLNTAWPLAKSLLNFGFSDEGQRLVAESAGYIVMNAALQAKMKQRIAEQGNKKADYIPTQPDECPRGSGIVVEESKNHWGMPKLMYECRECAPGKSKQTDAARECSDCIAGYFTAVRGRSICDPCPQGTYSFQGSATCTNCSVNEVAPLPGKAECEVCPLGEHTDSMGQSQCKRCSLGKYKDTVGGNGSCITCPVSGTTTIYEAAVRLEDCMCAPGSYHGRSSGPCLTCKEGMSCAFGSQEDGFADWMPGSDVAIPTLKEGFYSRWSAPLEVFRCVDLEACPGGPPEHCRGGRTGLVCAACPDGKTLRGNVCTPCSRANLSIVAVGPFVLACAIASLYYLGNSRMFVNVSVSVAASITISFSLTVLQVLSSYKDLGIPWPSEIKALFDILSITTLSRRSIPYACAFNTHDPLVRYLFRCMMPLTLLVITVLLGLVSRPICRLLRKPERQWRMDKTLNTLGQMLQAVFIATAGIVAVPLQGYDHPTGKTSVLHYPAVLFGTTTQVKLLVFATLTMMLFVLPFQAWCLWGSYRVVRVPRRLADAWMIKLRFLFYRFRPDRWWWGNIFSIRQLLLAFAASLPSSKPQLQIVFVVAVLVTYAAIQARCWPWKSWQFNVLDAFVCCLMVLISCTAMAFDGRGPQQDYLALMKVEIVVLFVGLGMCGITYVCYLARHMCPSGTLSNKGPSENKSVNQLGCQWMRLCKMCVDQGEADLVRLCGTMNSYDRMALLESLHIWQSTAAASFLEEGEQLPRRRLVGLPHTNKHAPWEASEQVRPMRLLSESTNASSVAAATVSPEGLKTNGGDCGGHPVPTFDPMLMCAALFSDNGGGCSVASGFTLSDAATAEVRELAPSFEPPKEEASRIQVKMTI